MVFKIAEEINLDELAGWLNLKKHGPSMLISNVASIEDVESGSLSFITKKYKFKGSSESICLISDSPDYFSTIISENPRLDFIRALAEINKRVGFYYEDAAPDIHPSVRIGENVVIENDVKIDEGTILEHGVVIKKKTRIGKNCLIRENACIGGDGFGFEFNSGVPVKFIHLGGVDIGDNVEVGACTCISRGALSNTKICANVKIDNLVHIAHNCLLEECSMIIAGAELSGGVVVGKGAWVGPNVCVKQKIRIGANSLVGIGAVVIKNVEEGTTVIGNPAKVLQKK